MVEQEDYPLAKDLVRKFINLLVSSTNYALKIKVDCLVHLYTSVDGSSGLKALAFELLVTLGQQEDCLDIMIKRIREIEADSKNWNLKIDERRSLYRVCARALDHYQDSSNAFKLMHAHLKLFSESDAKDIAAAEDDARRSVILAIKAIDVINFAELLELPVIKQLTSKHPEVSQLLNLFNDVSASEFEPQIAKFTSLMEREGLTRQELIRKKSYVQICTISTQSKTNYKYTELSQLLNIDEAEIEEWAVEAIQNKIIDAKID